MPELGRDPAAVRRSVLLFDALDAWTGPDQLEKVVSRFGDVGMHEFVIFWPPPGRVAELEHVAELMEAMR